MDREHAHETTNAAAGDFATWLGGLRAVLDDGATSAVPCGSCDACCRSSQFIHIAPNESGALRRIPKTLLFPAPGLPKGHVLMGYTADGHCPMLRNNACSIYDDRPQTCRAYDCRVFAASSDYPDDLSKDEVAQRSRAWHFSYNDETSRALHTAVERASAFLRDHPECFTDGSAPTNAIQRTLAAIEIHALFTTATATEVVNNPSADPMTSATIGSMIEPMVDRVRDRLAYARSHDAIGGN